MKKIKAVILDLGVVIINIDQEKTRMAFEQLGLNLKDVNESLPFFLQLEKGKISKESFIYSIKQLLNNNATDEQIIKAWNAMILDLPANRISLINELSNHYAVFLLSNTNVFHIEEIMGNINQYHPNLNWESTFEKIFLSYEIGHRKPDAACYEYVLNDIKLHAHETIFVDDSKSNIEGAEKVGINCIWTQKAIDTWLWDEIKKYDPDLQLH